MISLKLKQGILGPTQMKEVEYENWKVVWDYIPNEYREQDFVVVILTKFVDGKPVKETLCDELINSVYPEDGDMISLIPVPSELTAAGVYVVGLAVQLIIAGILLAGEWAYDKYVTQADEERAEEIKSGIRYSAAVMGNEFNDIGTLPLVTGKVRTGGPSLQTSSSSSWTNGPRTVGANIGFSYGDTRLKSIIAVSQGVCESISECHIDGNNLSNYTGSSLTTKLGTIDQAAIAGFEDAGTTTLTNQKIQNPGSEITMSGTTDADHFIIRMNFADGLYRTDSDGKPTVSNFFLETRYRVTSGPGAWSAWTRATLSLRAYGSIDVWYWFTFPSRDTYDIQVRQAVSSHNPAHRSVGEAYLTEYQEVIDEDFRYQGIAIAGVEAIAYEQLFGRTGRYTFLTEGVILNSIDSGTAVSAPVFKRKPMHTLGGMLFNRRYGAAKDIDARVKTDLTSITGVFTVGEIVRGPAHDYQYVGKVKSWSTPTLVVESIQGLPYGILTGDDSSAFGTTGSIECLGIDLPALYTCQTFNEGLVPDGKNSSNVDAISALGAKLLYVSDTDPFTVTDNIVVNYEGAREESHIVAAINPGVSLTTTVNLTYNHAGVGEEDRVDVTEERHFFDYTWIGNLNVKKAISKICRTCRVVPVYYGAYISFFPLRAETPQQVVTQGNILRPNGKSSLTVTIREQGDARPNRIISKFLNEDIEYADDVVQIDDPAAKVAGEAVRVQREDSYGMTRPSQVSRESMFWLKRMRYTGVLVEFSMGIDALDFEVGDVFEFAHDVIGIGYGSGRTVSSTNDTVNLDHPRTIPAGTHTITIRHKDGTKETRTITTAAGEHVQFTVSVAWTQNPAAGDVYSIGLGQFRCVSMEPTSNWRIKIMAEEDDDAYYVDDFGLLPTFSPSTFPDNTEIPDAVDNLTLTEAKEVREEKLQNVIDVNWQFPTTSNIQLSADIYYRETLGPKLTFGRKIQTNESLGNTTFNHPSGICEDGVYMYFCDTDNHRVIAYDYITGDYVREVGSYGTGDNQFKSPVACCTDGTNLYVLELLGNRINKRLCSDLSFVAKAGTVGTGNSQFSKPRDIDMDSNWLFIADAGNNRIARWTHAIVYDSNIGGTAAGTGNDEFDTPYGITVNTNNVFVADTKNHRIHKRTLALVYADKIGTNGYDTDKFTGPRGISANDSVLYITDSGVYSSTAYSRLMIRGLDLSATSEWGVGSGSGPDQMDLPMDVQLSSDGSFFLVTDTRNHRITRYVVDTIVEWSYLGETKFQHYRIRDEYNAGTYLSVAVVSRAPGGSRKSVDSSSSATILVLEDALVPSSVPALFHKFISGSELRLFWNRSTSKSTSYFRVKIGTDWETGILIQQEKIYNNYIAIYPPGAQSVYWVKAYNAGGVECATAVSATVVPPGTCGYGSSTGSVIKTNNASI